MTIIVIIEVGVCFFNIYILLHIHTNVYIYICISLKRIHIVYIQMSVFTPLRFFGRPNKKKHRPKWMSQKSSGLHSVHPQKLTWQAGTSAFFNRRYILENGWKIHCHVSFQGCTFICSQGYLVKNIKQQSSHLSW